MEDITPEINPEMEDVSKTPEEMEEGMKKPEDELSDDALVPEAPEGEDESVM